MMNRAILILLSFLVVERPPVPAAEEEVTPAEYSAPSSDSEILWVYLYPRSGEASHDDLEHRSVLSDRLNEALSRHLEGTPYSEIRVRVQNSIFQAEQALQSGEGVVVEYDPYLYFAVLSRMGVGAPEYRVILQRQLEAPVTAEIRVRPDGPVRRPEDLRRRWLGVFALGAGSEIRARELLSEVGLESGAHYVAAETRDIENALLCLRLGIVDAIVLPADLAATASGIEETVLIGRTTPYLPPLFAVRVSDFEGFPALIHKLRNELREHYGPEGLVPASEELYFSVEESAQ